MQALSRPALAPPIPELARAVEAQGGRALVVGGWVRDRLLGLDPKDVDLEVSGLPARDLERVLSTFGDVFAVGDAFSVLRIAGLDFEVSIARRSSVDPDAGEVSTFDFAAAAGRRDLTINAIGWDPLREEILDPYGGQEDLRRRVLRAVDSRRFGEDPLRGMRVAYFAARLEMQPDAELCALCEALDLSAVSSERLYREWRRLLLEPVCPGPGLDFLERTRLLRFFPELDALRDVPQDPEWHPEGCVFTHTRMTVDAAAALRSGDAVRDTPLMFAALCHDLGKPLVTEVTEGGRIRSLGHDQAGVDPSKHFLERLRAPHAVVAGVAALVAHHLAPAQLFSQRASPRAYRRLARKLERAGVSLELLECVARADHFGRTTADARAHRFEAGDAFIEQAGALRVAASGPRDVVLGRHVLARGYAPGKQVGAVLERCREVQDTTGWVDPRQILDRVLEEEDR